MSTAAEKILATLAEHGIKIRAKENGNLGIMPADRLDDNLRQQILANKAAILDILKAPTKPKAPPPPAKPKLTDRRQIALAALQAVEHNAATQAKVWQAARKLEQDWSFLQEHGYPAGWFALSHVDNYLRLTYGKAICVEETPSGDVYWWNIEAAKT